MAMKNKFLDTLKRFFLKTEKEESQSISDSSKELTQSVEKIETSPNDNEDGENENSHKNIGPIDFGESPKDSYIIRAIEHTIEEGQTIIDMFVYDNKLLIIFTSIDDYKMKDVAIEFNRDTGEINTLDPVGMFLYLGFKVEEEVTVGIFMYFVSTYGKLHKFLIPVNNRIVDEEIAKDFSKAIGNYNIYDVMCKNNYIILNQEQVKRFDSFV